MAANFTLAWTPPIGSVLNIGAGYPVGIKGAQGLDDMPDLRTQDDTRGYADGMFFGRDFLSGRTVSLDLEVFADTANGLTAWQVLDALKTSTAPAVGGSTSVGVLQRQLPGQVYKRLNCRVRRRRIPLDVPYEAGRIGVTLELYAADPRWYADIASSASATLPTATTGMTFNETFNLSFGGGATGNAMQIANAGNTTTYPVFTITGPVTNPTLATSTATLALNLALVAGDVLVIDTDLRTVTLNGQSRRSALTNTSAWFAALPGTTSVFFNGTSAGAPSCTASYRSAWA